MLAEYAVFNEKAVVLLPTHLSFEEAATLPCAAVTAWVALTGYRRVTAGDTVLTQGSGGVSVFALQFARILGARVIATTSTAEKAERLKALGASDVINYTETPDWDAKVRELTDGRGVDCIVEIGGPGTIAMSLKALAVGGHVSLIGASLSSSRTGLDPLLLTGRGITLGSISVGSRADFEAMNRASAMHRLHPVIDRTFPFAEAKAAYRHFEGRGHFGKVVIAHADDVRQVLTWQRDGRRWGRSDQLYRSPLPTPHGEREPALSWRHSGSGAISNPSWGTGTAGTHVHHEILTPLPTLMGNGNRSTTGLSLKRLSIFQPLMGNGNRGGPCHRKRSPTSSNPSWGTGTQRDPLVGARLILLPTPHGEREPINGSCPSCNSNDFQPLMGNGNRR